MKSKHWILLVFAFFGITFIALSTFIIQNDPFQIWKRHDKGFPNNERFMNAGLINTYLNAELGYDSVIIGTSLTENYSPKQIEEKMHFGKVLKLSAKGSRSIVQYMILSKALATGKVKNVIWGFHTTEWNKKESVIKQKFTFPKYLYNTNQITEMLGKIRYLMSFQTMFAAYDLYSGKKYGEHWEWKHSSLDGIYSWGAHRESKGYFEKWNSKENIKKLKTQYTKVVESKRNYKFQYLKDFPLFDQYVITTIEANPDVNFYLVFSPMSKLLLTTSSNSYISQRKYIVEKFGNHKNVKIFSFDTCDFVNDLNSYMDMSHFRPRYNNFIVEKMADNEYLLTPNNIDDYVKLMEEQIRNYDFYSSAREGD